MRNIIEWRDWLYESDLSYKAKHVGMALSQFYRRSNATYPSIRVLCQRTSLTQNPVQDGIDELIENGFIKREQKRMPGNRFISNIYVFTGVTEGEHVSPRDTSNITSNITSNDTSYDTSYDMSPRDTEVGEKKEEKRKKEEGVQEKPSPYPKNNNLLKPSYPTTARESENSMSSEEIAEVLAELGGVNKNFDSQGRGGGGEEWDAREHLSEKLIREGEQILPYWDINLVLQDYNKWMNETKPGDEKPRWAVTRDHRAAWLGFCRKYKQRRVGSG